MSVASLRLPPSVPRPVIVPFAQMKARSLPSPRALVPTTWLALLIAAAVLHRAAKRAEVPHDAVLPEERACTPGRVGRGTHDLTEIVDVLGHPTNLLAGEAPEPNRDPGGRRDGSRDLVFRSRSRLCGRVFRGAAGEGDQGAGEGVQHAAHIRGSGWGIISEGTPPGSSRYQVLNSTSPDTGTPRPPAPGTPPP